MPLSTRERPSGVFERYKPSLKRKRTTINYQKEDKIARSIKSRAEPEPVKERERIYCIFDETMSVNIWGGGKKLERDMRFDISIAAALIFNLLGEGGTAGRASGDKVHVRQIFPSPRAKVGAVDSKQRRDKMGRTIAAGAMRRLKGEIENAQVSEGGQRILD
eukprot:646985-Amorphochlora_amoeboformis.AAC.1